MQAVFGLGRIAALKKDWQKVVELVAPLVQRYPNVRTLHQLLLDAYEALGRADLAAQERRRLLDPDLIVIPLVKYPLDEELLALSCSSTRLLKEAGLLRRFGKPNEAIRVALRAVDVEPGDSDVHHCLGRMLLDAHGAEAESVSEALNHLREGLRLKPDDLVPLWYFATSFFKQDKTDEAVERLRSMLAAHAGKAESHYYLGGSRTVRVAPLRPSNISVRRCEAIPGTQKLSTSWASPSPPKGSSAKRSRISKRRWI